MTLRPARAPSPSLGVIAQNLGSARTETLAPHPAGLGGALDAPATDDHRRPPAPILFGWLQEKYEQPGAGGWLPFWFGCVAGAVPWVAVVIYTIAPQSPSDASPPGFVYAIVVSLFVFFNIFALNQVLQYRARGRWADYLFGENVYIVLSLVAKSLLAWQVFGGTLAG